MESLCSDSQCRKEQSERSRITPVSPFPPVRRLYICVGVGVNSVSCLHCPFLSLKVPRGARTCPVAPPAAADTQGRGCSRRSSRVSRSCWSWSWNGPGHGRGGWAPGSTGRQTSQPGLVFQATWKGLSSIAMLAPTRGT